MTSLDAIKARLGSISSSKRRLIEHACPAAAKLLFEDIPFLIRIIEDEDMDA